jgi:hypothetical protein
VSRLENVSAPAVDWMANAIHAACESPRDPRTFELWAAVAGTCARTLRSHCRAAHIQGQAALDFARLLRARLQGRRSGWPWPDLLDIVEPRTLTRLLERGGFRSVGRSVWTRCHLGNSVRRSGS